LESLNSQNTVNILEVYYNTNLNPVKSLKGNDNEDNNRIKALKNFQVLGKDMNDINDLFKAGNKKSSVFDKYKKNKGEKGYSHMIEEKGENLLNLVENEREAKGLNDPNSLNNSNGMYNESKFRLKQDDSLTKKVDIRGLNLDFRRGKGFDSDFMDDEY
jgi:hypothetical protein